MTLLFFIILLILFLFALTIYLWVRQRRYLKKKTSQAMRQETWDEIVAEREEILHKRRQFRKALEEAKKRF